MLNEHQTLAGLFPSGNGTIFAGSAVYY